MRTSQRLHAMHRSNILARAVVFFAIFSALSGANANDTLMAEFLARHGEDVEACFQKMPEVQSAGAPAKFEKGAAPLNGAPLNRLIIAVDASGSMAAKVGGQIKMDAAKSAVSEFLKTIPPDVEVGLVAFGHRGTNAESGKATSCAGVETLSAASKDRTKTAEAMNMLKATGWTPLAMAITQAGNSFEAGNGEKGQVVYVVSDGLETCGGDPINAARQLHSGNIKAVINIIGFDLSPADRAQLKAVASAGGGQFLEAKTGSDLKQALAESSRQTRNAVVHAREVTQSGTKTAKNTTRTAVAGAQLTTCVATKTSQETRKAAGFSREKKLSGVALTTFDANVRTRHGQYESRVAKVNEQLKSNEQSANTGIQRQLEQTEKAAAQSK